MATKKEKTKSKKKIDTAVNNIDKNNRNKAKKNTKKTTKKVLQKKKSMPKSKLKLSAKIKKIAKKAKTRIPKIRNIKEEKRTIEDTILKSVPKKEKREWPKEKKREGKKENLEEREQRMNPRRGSTGVTLQPQSEQPILRTASTESTRSTSLEDAVEEFPSNRNIKGITSEIIYDKIQNLTQKFLEGKLSQKDYMTLWNYHQIFRNEKGFLDEYIKNLNPRQMELLQRAQYLMRENPINSNIVQYARRIEPSVVYARANPQLLNVREYVASNSRRIESIDMKRRETRREETNIIDKKKDISKDYIPKSK